MPINPTYSPCHQIEDSIVAQLQAYTPLTAVIAASRIRTRWNNRVDGTSQAALAATNIMVLADDDGCDPESVGPVLFKFSLAMLAITAQDAATTELVAPLIIPHLLHEAICGALWYAWLQNQITPPALTGLKYAVTGPGREARWIYKGKGPNESDGKWFADAFIFDLHYVRDRSWPPVTT